MADERTQRWGALALAGFVATIFAANWFVAHVGAQPVPDGPHVVPVGFGLTAPSGVLWVGVAFTLRDLVQSWLGKAWVVGALVAGAVLSALVAPAFALASGTAFLVGEGLDFAVYTPLVERGRWLLAVAASNTVGAVVDSLVFLGLAFGSFAFWQGQVVGKLAMTLLAVVLLRLARPRLRLAALQPSAAS